MSYQMEDSDEINNYYLNFNITIILRTHPLTHTFTPTHGHKKHFSLAPILFLVFSFYNL